MTPVFINNFKLLQYTQEQGECENEANTFLTELLEICMGSKTTEHVFYYSLFIDLSQKA